MEKLERAEQLKPGSAAYNMACCLAQMGRTDEALSWLERDLRERPRMRSHARQDPDLEPLRQDSRFLALTRAQK